MGQALVTGALIERYGREWRMGPIVRGRQYFDGRIGFQRVSGTAEIWDERQQDFREQAVLFGLTAPFVIRRSDLRVAFQRRPGVIERQSFAGALQALLDEESSYAGWRVEPEAEPVGWQEFVDSVDRVAKLVIRVNRPNPNYQGRRRLERLIEGAKARYISLTAVAQEGEGIDPTEPTIAEAIAHVASEYGTIKAEGPRAGETVKYDSERHGVAPEQRIPLPPGQHEATTAQLRGTLPSDEAPPESS